MKTCKANTFAAMNSAFLNTETMRINASYLNDSLHMFLANNQTLYARLINPRIKPTAICWEALVVLANDRLDGERMPTRATSAHLKAWLNEWSADYGILQPTIDWIIDYRETYNG